MAWDEHKGQVSRAFDEWRLAEQDIRAFLKLGLAFSDEGYRSRWHAIAHQPSDGEGPDMFDLMDRAVDGLIPSDFKWLLANLCIRDGVTLYETYLEKGLEEIYARHVGTPIVQDRSPNAIAVVDVYRKVLRVQARPMPVRRVIALRDLLTHRRGELRTEQHRKRYDTKQLGFPDLTVQLPYEEVVRALDALRGAAVRVDSTVSALSWGKRRLTVRKRDELFAKTKKWLQPEA